MLKNDQTVLSDEVDAIRERYARRTGINIYSPLRPEVQLAWAERQYATADLLRNHSSKPLDNMTLLDLGCGNGGNLLDFLRLGFRPENLRGLELLDERVSAARAILPDSLRVDAGDALKSQIAPRSIDIVFQSVVFSSILSEEFQMQLASKVWDWIAPGGGMLWYDFVYDNPANKDVVGVKLKRIQELFPDGKIDYRRITLAPPLSRRLAPWGKIPISMLGSLKFLNTHIMAWIGK